MQVTMDIQGHRCRAVRVTALTRRSWTPPVHAGRHDRRMDESLDDPRWLPLGVVVGRVALPRGAPTWSSGSVIAWREAHAVTVRDVVGPLLVMCLFDPADAAARPEMRRVLAVIRSHPGIACVVIIPAGSAGSAGVHELARQLEACVLEAPAAPGALSRAADMLAGAMVLLGLTCFFWFEVRRLLSPGRVGKFAVFEEAGPAMDSFISGDHVVEQAEDAIAIVRCATDVTLVWINEVASAVQRLLPEDGTLLVATPAEEDCVVSALTVITLAQS